MGKASYAETINLPTAEYGDTFSGWERILEVNDVAKDLTGATIVLTLSDGGGSLTSVDSGGISITGDTSGKFTIDEQVITFIPRTYHYEIKFTFSDGSIKTYIEGTWKITG